YASLLRGRAADLEPPAVPPSRDDQLPEPLTPLIGRERELAAVRQAVAGSRLVRLTGEGGTGKSRLALEAARALAPQFADGARMVDLSGVPDPALVAETILSATGITHEAGQSAVQALLAVYRVRHMLLILDNCEHVTVRLRELTARMLEACPRLHVLVTSQQALGIPGEVIWPVPPLAVPRPGAEVRSPAELETYGAVALFVERARRVQPDFTLTRSNAAAVVDICRRLDGNPLALQLAASRVGVLTPAQIAELLEDRFNLLTTGDPSGPARHRTLRAAASWSYSLLSDEERALFDRPAVFAGGFTLEAAAAIANGPRGPGADD